MSSNGCGINGFSLVSVLFLTGQFNIDSFFILFFVVICIYKSKSVLKTTSLDSSVEKE